MMKRAVIIVIILLVAAGLIFFSTMWPLKSEENLGGTLAGVEKAEKYRGAQPEREDLFLQEDEINTLTQSAEWQNVMKNEDLVKFLQSDDFQKYIYFQNDMQKLVIANLCYNTVKSVLLKGTEIDQELTDMTYSDDFQGMTQCYTREFYKLLKGRPGSTFMRFDEAMKMLYNSNDIQNAIVLNSHDVQKLVLSQEFEKWLSSDQFGEMNKLYITFARDFQKFAGENFMVFLIPIWGSTDFQSVWPVLANDFQKIVFSQDFQNTLFTPSNDFNNLLTIPNSADFQHICFSHDFNSLMQNDIMQSITTFSNGFEVVKNAASF